MKLKKKVKKRLVILLILIIIGSGALYIYKYKDAKPEIKEAQVLNQIDEYGYTLKDNKSKKYQSLFNELEKILNEKEVDEEKYAAKIAEMFIVDFYSLNDKSAKTDIGGVDFVHPDILSNFLLNAEDTLYKYVESNIYGNRTQKLPTINEVLISSVESTEFTYNDKTDENAYLVKTEWNYLEDEFSDYQTSASMIFVHEDKKLYLVELA